MEVIKIDAKQIQHILNLEEDHFNDLKSKRIAPAKLQETFVAFANSDGGDLYVGIEDKSSGVERVIGFVNQEEANGLVTTLLEETQPAVENVQVEFLQVESKGLVLHIAIPKSPKVHYTASGDCYIRLNASKRKIKEDGSYTFFSSLYNAENSSTACAHGTAPSTLQWNINNGVFILSALKMGDSST